jgi:TrmH family RNA methyltransferase
MSSPLLHSRAHPLLKIGRSLHEAKGRREHALFLIEGANAVGAALKNDWPLREVFALEEERELSSQAELRGLPVRRASRDWLAGMSDSQTPPPLIAWGELPPPVDDFELEQGLLVVLDGVGDPGNVGTLWRASHALGASKIIASRGTADVWNPKVVRSAAGSLFALPPVALRDNSPGNIARLLGEKGIEVVRADAHGDLDLSSFKWPTRAALVLGHETRGVSEEFAGASVTIPLPGNAESLNVAMAGTIFLWEWTRRLASRGGEEERGRRGD